MSPVNPIFANVGCLSIRIFGVPVVYGRGSDSFSVPGIFDRNYASVVLDESGVPVQSVNPMLFAMAEDLPGGFARKGDRVEVDGERYTVQEQQPDSEGGVKLLLRKG